MSSPAYTPIVIAGKPYRYRAEAAAGVRLRDRSKWWGTRLTYGPKGSARLEHITIVDTHPFDLAELELALTQWVTVGKAASS